MSSPIDMLNKLEEELLTKINHSLDYSNDPNVIRGDFYPEGPVENPIICLALADLEVGFDISSGGMNYFNVDIYGYCNSYDEDKKNSNLILAMDILYFLTSVYTYKDDFMGIVDNRIRLLDGTAESCSEFLFRAKFKYDFDTTTIRIKE